MSTGLRFAPERTSRALGLVLALAALFLADGAAANAAEVAVRWIRSGAVMKAKTVTIAELEALPQVTFTTHTTWTTGPLEFTGPSLRDVAALGSGRAVSAHVAALDDFSAQLPASDWEELGAILAVRLNGERMRVRDKGPFWVMFPADDNPEVLDTELYHGRMVWSVNRIDFDIR